MAMILLCIGCFGLGVSVGVGVTLWGLMDD